MLAVYFMGKEYMIHILHTFFYVYFLFSLKKICINKHEYTKCGYLIPANEWMVLLIFVAAPSIYLRHFIGFPTCNIMDSFMIWLTDFILCL